jgi:parallel beta-helix repeat protein
LDVRAFGAVGDGVTDDTAAVLAALNSGAPVLVPDGTYLMTAITVQNRNGLRVFGSGTLKAAASVTGNFIVIQRSDDVVFEGITISHNAVGGGAVADNLTLEVCDNFTVRGVKFLDIADSGLMVSECEGGRVSDCYFEDAVDVGIYISDSVNNPDFLQDVVVYGCVFVDCAISAIAVKREGKNVSIVGNVMRGGANGITLEQASTETDFSGECVITGNVINDVSAVGVVLRGIGGSTVSANRIIDALVGVQIDGSFDNTVTANVIKSAVALSTGVRIKDYITPSVVTYNSYDNVVSANKIVSTLYGIHLRENATKNIVQGNNVESTNHGIYLVENAAENIIVGNRVVSDQHAIRVGDGAASAGANENIIHSNIARGAVANFTVLVGNDNCSLQGNKALGAGTAYNLGTLTARVERDVQRGESNIPDGSATVTVAHGFGVAPTSAVVTSRNTSFPIFVTGKNTTNVTVSRGAGASTVGVINFEYIFQE